jgi:hypothetical protein
MGSSYAVDEIPRLRQREEDNRKVKQPVGDLSPDGSMLQDVFSKKLYSLRVDGSLSSGSAEGRAESRQERAATRRERGAAAPANRGACCE